MNPAQKAKLAAQAQRRHDAERRRLYAALTRGQLPTGDPQYTVHYDSRPVTVTQLEYLWLLVRGHLRTTHDGHAVVIDQAYIRLHTTKEFTHARPS